MKVSLLCHFWILTPSVEVSGKMQSGWLRASASRGGLHVLESILSGKGISWWDSGNGWYTSPACYCLVQLAVCDRLWWIRIQNPKSWKPATMTSCFQAGAHKLMQARNTMSINEVYLCSWCHENIIYICPSVMSKWGPLKIPGKIGSIKTLCMVDLW